MNAVASEVVGSRRLDSMRVGDVFIDRGGFRVWRITGWYKGRVGECPLTRCLDTGEDSMFAGCAEPYGPFRGVESVIVAIDALVDALTARMNAASPTARAIRPEALDWASPDESALHVALSRAYVALAPTTEEIRARVARRRAARVRDV